jgi:hypothetical protein
MVEFVKCKHKFLDKPIHRIIENSRLEIELRKQIRRIFHEKNNESSFPGAQPISLEKKNIRTIKNSDYLAGAKLDGERFFLFVTQVGEKNLSLIIDRTFTFYLVSQKWVHRNSYIKKILVDGELTENGFHVHDVFLVEGQNVMDLSFDARLRIFKSFLKASRWESTSKKNTFNISLKHFYKISDLDKLAKTESFRNKSDGIVFYPVNEPVQKRTQFTLFKWKPPGCHTIDFKIKQNSGDSENLLPEDEKSTDLITWDPKERREYTYETVEYINEFPDEAIVEFNVHLDDENPDEVVFEPIKIRTDKSTGNSQFTIDRTIFNVKENITLEYLLEKMC